jgi:hypothetical protein
MMFESSTVRGLRQRFRKFEEPIEPYDGMNRRATAILPEHGSDQTASMSIDMSLGRQRLLVGIEANQQTGCIKIASERRRSRGAMLVFRGRVLGTLYSSKHQQGLLYDQAAHARICNDLVDPESAIYAHVLDEEIVIAAASLFHGQPIGIQQNGNVIETVNTFLRLLMQSNLPGCIMISDLDNRPLCSVYLYGGRVVGLYSARDGWLKATTEAVVDQAAKNPIALVSGSMLQTRSAEEVALLTFSLSGLGDRRAESHCTPMQQQVTAGMCFPKVDVVKLAREERARSVQADRFIPGRRGGINSLLSAAAKRNPFSVNP